MIDKDEYPQTAEIERRCVHMLADLWNSPEAANTVGASAIGSYLGAGTRFDEAMAAFASSYADQNELDHQALKLAIATNKVHAISDV